MEITIPLRLSTLGHPQRLAVFRLLMRRYPGRVAAGEIGAALDVKPSTLSSYLSALVQVGLVTQTREGTSLLYQVDMDGMRETMNALFLDCCRGRPELCLPNALSAVATSSAMTHPKYNVLFICTGNSARSLLAEAILNHEGGGRFRAFSAGTRPSPGPRPEVTALLRAKGYDTAGLRSKDLDEFASPGAPQMDFVFTVCDHAANEECPAWPGQPMSAHWGLADPVKATGTDAERRLAFQQAFGLLRNRIKAFVALPFETLDRMSLQHRVDDLGRVNSSD